MKLSLKSISLFNFLSFRGHHTITLPEKGLVGVTGSYASDQSLSNGSGKSSFIRSINYLLLIDELTNSQLQNWKDETPFSVTGEFKLDDEILTITRGSGLFKVTFQGNTVSGEEAKTYLKQLLLPPDILEKISYRVQGSEGIFIPLSSSERYQFLYEITDLGKLEQIVIASNDTIKTKEKELIQLNLNKISQEEKMSWYQSQITNINGQISEIQHRIYAADTELINLKEPQEKDFKFSLNSLQKQIQSLRNIEPQHLDFENSQIMSDIENEITKLKEAPLLSAEDVYSIKVNSLNENLKAIQQEELDELMGLNSVDGLISKYSADLLRDELVIQDYLSDNPHPVEVKNQAEQAVEAKQKVIDRLTKVEGSVCPECSNEIGSDDLIVIKFKYQKELETLERVINLYLDNKLKVDSMIGLINQNTTLKNQLDDFSNQKKIINLELGNIRHKINHINQAIQTCKDTTEIEIQNLKDKRHGQLNLLNNQLANHKEIFRNNFLTAKNNWLTSLSKLEKELELKTQENNESYHKAFNTFERLKTELQTKINSFKNETERAKKNILDFNNQILELNSNIANTLKNIKDNEHQIKIETELCNALGKNGFAGAYLTDILNLLTELTNNNLNSISIMDRFSVNIDSEKVLKNLNVKPDINVQIFCAEKEIAYKALSGGQKQALNFAIDKAVDKLITDKHDKQINWLLLDEPFSALDLTGKQGAVELLKRHSGEKLVLITDHSLFLGESLDGEIKITFKDQESSFELTSGN